MGITLDQLLNARDARRGRQLSLLEKYPDSTLIVLTVNIPGSEKRTADSLTIADRGVEALSELFAGKIIYEQHLDLPTGRESYFMVSLPSDEVKTLTTGIEDEHPLGRLMDIDVFLPDGTPLSRRDTDTPARRCLICGDDARACMRNQTHPLPELLKKIHSMVESCRISK